MERKNALMVFVLSSILVLVIIPNSVTPSYAASQLFGIAGTGGGTSSISTFYTINTNNGAAAPVGLVGFNGCDAMEIAQDGTIYATCNRTGTSTNVLITINRVTGAGAEVGPTGVGLGGAGSNTGPKDMSFRNSDGVLFGYTHDCGRGFNLMTINLATGLATSIGGSGTCSQGNGLTFTPGDTLLVKEEFTLWEVNQVTGMLSNSIATADIDTAIDYNPDDGLQYAAKRATSGAGSGAGSSLRDLVTINPVTGASTIIGSTVNGLTAIAFDPSDDSDGDGVPNDQDICPGFDDNVDTDGDGVPDGCDPFDSSQVCGTGTIGDNDLQQCVPDLNSICGDGTFISGLQCLGLGMQPIGGTYIPIDTLAVLGAAVGVDPLITGLVVITMVGITGQVAWFVHRKKRK